MRGAVERHLAVLREAVAAHGGVLFKVVGDATQSAFSAAPDALAAAMQSQQTLLAEQWLDAIGAPRVRMALHAGEATPRDGDYLAAPLNRLARLLAAGHGCQMLVTEVVERLVIGSLPAGASLHSLGTHRLRDLQEPEEVFQIVAPGLPEQFPPLRSLPAHPTNLTTPPTTLFGREEEVAMVLRLLNEGARLVTLTGAGGTGKTRLGQAVAAEVLDRYPDGVLFVDLSPLRDATLVLSTIAATLGVREVTGQALRDTLVAYLESKSLLLVLDNMEHVLAAAAEIAAVVAACSQLVMLTTSREPLHLRAEREIVVAPLPYPAPGLRLSPDELAAVPAVALFVDRAVAANAGFALTASNAAAIAVICQRLEGLPLAIELAAARMKVMGPDALLSRLVSRLPLLTGGARDLPARQQTLRETIAWSFDLLARDEQVLFRRLAIFAGGWTLEAAEEVASLDGERDVLAVLTSLVDKSLVWLDQHAPEPRYRMLETVREFAWDELQQAGEVDDLRDRQAAWVLGLGERLWTALMRGPVAPQWLTRSVPEIDNVRAALVRLDETGDVDGLLRLTGSLFAYWLAGGFRQEGQAWVHRALMSEGGRDQVARLRALMCAASLVRGVDRNDESSAFAHEALALAERLDDPWAASASQYSLGSLAVARGAYDEAESFFAAAMAKFDERSDADWIALVTYDRAIAAYGRGDLALAQTRLEESLRLHHAIGDTWTGAKTLDGLTRIALRRRAFQSAAAALRDSLALHREFPGREGIVAWLVPVSMLASTAGQEADAARLLGAGAALCEEYGVPLQFPDRTDIEGSTRLWEHDRVTMHGAVERHLTILREAVTAHDGALFKVIGDATQSAFATAPNAVAAAVEAQQVLLAEPWADASGRLEVRMALHAGEATPRDGDYLAAPLNRLSRLLSAGHGSQILLTEVVARLVAGQLPAGVSLRALGAHRLRDLVEPEEVFQAVVPELPDQFSPLRSLPHHPTNLTAPPTALIGREVEVAAVLRLLDEGARLVTLTGPGGTGKTRLAQEVAVEVLERYEDGVFFVDLSPLRDAALVVPTIAAALYVREAPGQAIRESLAAHFSRKRQLVVLDNCEQVLDAAPDVAALLAACSKLAILATSREPLHVRAEREFLVPPLPLPAADRLLPIEELARISAIALFVERATASQPDFALTADNASAVAAICRRLDGLPLAIELAAARVKVLPPAALLARLEKRLPLLTGGGRDLPARQRTMRDAIAWSYDLLAPGEQVLFRRLAVFAGGFTLTAAEAMEDPDGEPGAFDGVAALLEHSLLRQTPSIGDEPRYLMLETVREFGLERLAAEGEEDEARQRHARHYLRLSDELSHSAWGVLHSQSRLARMATELDNVRLALAWCDEHHEIHALLRMSSVFWMLWHARGLYREGLALVERALARSSRNASVARIKALNGAGVMAVFHGDYARAATLIDEERALAEETR